MDKVLITGITGFVGSHVLWELTRQQPEKIRAIYRDDSTIKGVKDLFKYKHKLHGTPKKPSELRSRIEWVQGDVKDIPSLTHAFKNVTQVYHCAAIISFDPGRFHQLQKTNIEGTANVVNLSIENGIEKLCMVSSIAALGETVDDTLITEDTQWDPNKDNSVYSISKFASEMEVWRGTQEGLDAVIVNPGVIFGEGAYKGGTGAFYRKIDEGLKYATPGVTGFVDVTDVARAMVMLMQSSIKNERFVLVAENTGIREVFATIAQSLGQAQKIKLVKPWQINIAWKADWFLSLFGKKRKLFKSMAKSAVSTTRYDGGKIVKELGFSYTPLATTLQRVARHYQEFYKKS